jgi:hypothetical protein
MTRWRVDIIRKRAEHLGTVAAKTEKEAIAAAIKQFEIEPARRNRVAVSKIGTAIDGPFLITASKRGVTCAILLSDARSMSAFTPIAIE